MKTPLGVYADTSVFGGCFDAEFKTESVQFFEEVRQGRFVLVVSNVTLDELELARAVISSTPLDSRSDFWKRGGFQGKRRGLWGGAAADLGSIVAIALAITWVWRLSIEQLTASVHRTKCNLGSGE